MKERPILFSGPMVQALLAGRKTQTRRVVKPRNFPGVVELMKQGVNIWVAIKAQFGMTDYQQYVKCPFGEPGDRLWVRETFASDDPQLVAYKADGWCGALMGDGAGGIVRIKHGWIVGQSQNDGTYRPLSAFGGKWKPSIFMPRWASRITLEVTDVRVQRLHDMAEEDAIAEGVVKVKDACHVIRGFDYDKIGLCHTDAVTPFYKLWDSINAASGYGSEADPWVWAITFRRVTL